MKTITAELLEHMENNGIWKTVTVDEEPQIGLTQWRIFKVESKSANKGDTIHFVGYTGNEGRVSSALQFYHQDIRKGVTQSGRIYELIDQPGFNKDAMYVWECWLVLNGSPGTTDITETYTGS